MIAPSFLDRVLDPVADALSCEAAKRIVELSLDGSTQTLLDELAAKAIAGTLSDEEREDYAELVDGLDLLAILKLKARTALRRQAS